MTKRKFIDDVYLYMALALDEAYAANGEVAEWAASSRYAQERIWVCYRLNKEHPSLAWFLLSHLNDTYLNSLLKRDVPKSVEALLRKVNVAAVADSLKIAL